MTQAACIGHTCSSLWAAAIVTAPRPVKLTSSGRQGGGARRGPAQQAESLRWRTGTRTRWLALSWNWWIRPRASGRSEFTSTPRTTEPRSLMLSETTCAGVLPPRRARGPPLAGHTLRMTARGWPVQPAGDPGVGDNYPRTVPVPQGFLVELLRQGHGTARASEGQVATTSTQGAARRRRSVVTSGRSRKTASWIYTASISRN